MYFLSSRAKALRQRFVPGQRSLSDTWQDTSNSYLNDDPRIASPDLGGSMLSLLDEPDVTSWQNNNYEMPTSTSTFKAQRSRSLDSLGSVPVSALLTLPCPPQASVAAQRHEEAAPDTQIPRPQASAPPSSMASGPFLSYMPGSSSSLASSFYNCLVPKIVDTPHSPIRFSATAPTTPIRLSAPSMPQFPELTAPLSCKYPDSFIPKIPGPPASPKHSRPTTPRTIPSSPITFRYEDTNLISSFPGSSQSATSSRSNIPMGLEPSRPASMFSPLPCLAPLAKSKPAEPTTKLVLESFVIPKIPGPPSSPKHFRPSSPRNVDYLCSEGLPGSPLLQPEVARPTALDYPAPLTVTCEDTAFIDASNSPESEKIPRRSCKRSATLPHKDGRSFLLMKAANLQSTTTDTSKSRLTATTTTTTTTVAPKASTGVRIDVESESFDHEEDRDTINESPLPVRPTIFDASARPKLKHQWSMDESRTKEVGLTSHPRPLAESHPPNSTTAPTKTAEKRRRFFMRKQTNSAPDSFDGPPHLSSNKSKEHHSVSFCLGSVRKCRGSDCSILQPNLPEIKLEPEPGVEHLADLKYPDGDPPCHFCCQQTSTSIHDENRLKIVSGGLIRCRDGSRDDSGTHYMNLPSPNVQTDGEQEASFDRRDVREAPRAGHVVVKEEVETEEQPPPASALTRRRALVPPKLQIADGTADDRKLSGSECSSPRARRSSIVVIPPMQICPGDLLVYSKVLTNRNNLLDFDGSTTSLAVSDTGDGVNSRKGKNTWSLLKLFERSNRGKSGSLCGLEEVLSCLPKVDFNDDQLSKFRGMCWPEFVAHVEEKSNTGGHRSGSSSSSTSPEPLPAPTPPRQPSPPPPPSPPTKRRLRGNLVRAQSERCFERKLTGSKIWRGFDRTLPLRAVPIEPTLSEKDLLVSPVSTTSRAECKRREAVWDLYQSECAFLYDHLMVLKNVFMEPLKKIQVEGFAMFAEPELLFGNLDELCCVTFAFCKEFINLLLTNVGPSGDLPTTEVLVKLFRKSSEADSVSHAYHCYALNYINALNYLETLRRHVEFCEFEKWCSRDPRCKKLQLTDLLVAPVQHIMKVPLILKEVETRTEEPTERLQIGEILEIEENSIRELDDKMKWLKNFERLLEIQRNVVWPSIFELDPKIYVPEFLKPALTRQPCDRIIVSPRRQIIIEGPMQLWDTGKPQEMYVVLFDDMLLITRRKKGLSKKKSSLSENWASSCSRGSTANETSMRYVVYKQPLSLDRFFIHDVSLPESASSRLEAAFVLVSLNRFQQVVTIHTFQAPSDQIKQTWVLKLRDTQDKWKRTLQHTVFRTPRGLQPGKTNAPPRKKSAT